MAVSSGVVIFVLVCGFSQISGSVIPKPALEAQRKTEKFDIRITEKGTTFYEKVDVDEDQEIAYFKVPGHNGVLASDVLFDFKTNISVTRNGGKSVCYVKPLPADLPRPGILNQGLQEFTSRPASFNIKTVSKQWIVNDEVNKMTLRREVREFCHQYPVYSLEEYKPDAVAVEHGRDRRSMDFKLCKNVYPPTHCRPDDWLYSCKVHDSPTCVYYITCTLNVVKKQICSDFDHRFDGLVCCTPTCP